MTTRRSILAAFVVAGLLAMLAAPVGADSGARPANGRIAGELAFTPVDLTECPASGTYLGGLRTDSFGIGNLTHLGRTVMTSSHCTPAGDVIAGGTGTFVAANGDEVWFTYAGTAPFPGPGTVVIDVTVTWQVVGGSGRFADAHGGGTGMAWVPFGGLGAPVWPGVTWVWQGTIGY